MRHDVADEADWARAVAAAEGLGGLHGLVNNAGIFIPRTLLETDAALFEQHTRVNQFGCFLGMKASVGAMERSGGGSIVNISSVAGLRGSPGAFAYSATKWALRGMTKAAAIDLAPRRIRVNSVHPGPIDTEMLKVRSAGGKPAAAATGADETHGHRGGGGYALFCSFCPTKAPTSPAPKITDRRRCFAVTGYWRQSSRSSPLRRASGSLA